MPALRVWWHLLYMLQDIFCRKICYSSRKLEETTPLSNRQPWEQDPGTLNMGKILTVEGTPQSLGRLHSCFSFGKDNQGVNSEEGSQWPFSCKRWGEKRQSVLLWHGRLSFILFQHDMIGLFLWWWGLTEASHMLSGGSIIKPHSQCIGGTLGFTYSKWSKQKLTLFLFLEGSVSILWKHISFNGLYLETSKCFTGDTNPLKLFCAHAWLSHWRCGSGCLPTRGDFSNSSYSARWWNLILNILHCTWVRHQS